MASPATASPTTPGTSSPPVGTGSLSGGVVPDYKDWVAEGKVSAVKDQQNCGSCWAFSAAAAFESKLAIEQGISWDQSVQQLLDCVDDSSGYTARTGCGPGMSTEAMGFLASRGGASASSYGSYQAKKGSCRTGVTTAHHITSSPGYRDITPASATELMKAVAQQPVVVLVWWPAYVRDVRGLFNGGCPSKPADSEDADGQYSSQYGVGANHEMLVVGYDARGGIGAPNSYFKVKNSWGTAVGNSGYFNLHMQPDGSGGICGLYSAPVAPLDVS
ncbi:hypothetical protein N2152v2_010415 [Parachlorella kessleri]